MTPAIGQLLPAEAPAGELTDAELVSAFQTGDPSAFEHLVRRYFGLVNSVAYARLRDREAAEDLTQEVFLRLYFGISTLREPRYFGTWASRITRNLASDWIRRDQYASRLVSLVPLQEEPKVQQKPADIPDPREAISRRESQQALEEAILHLPTDQREVLILYYEQGMTQQEIAARLEVHHTTVCRLLARAVSRLRRWSERLEENRQFPRPANRAAMARTVALITAVGAMSAESRRTLAAAVLAPRERAAINLAALGASVKTGAVHASIPATAGKIITVSSIKGAIMTSKAKLGLGVLAVALVTSGAYHATHPGELSQMFRKAGRTKPERGEPFRSPSSFVPELESGEEVFIRTSPETLPQFVVRLRTFADGKITAEFDVPPMLVTDFPLEVASADASRLQLISTGEFGLRLERNGDRLVGTAEFPRLARSTEGTTQPIEFRRAESALPIHRKLPTPVTLDDATLDQYVGRYQMSARTAITVQREGAQLIATATGRTPLPIYPLGNDRFFYRAVPSELSFGKNADGKVTRLVLHASVDTPARKVQ